ncbi:8-oxo-dGTP diphosphatase [Microdochium nivale]|nr:8-oxo-dGTP diphosphatase [Microdochium nivale]
MATVLTPTNKAVLAMTSTEYLNLLAPKSIDGALSTICSPVSATSTFSSIWSSRRPSASSDVSKATEQDDDDDDEECVHVVVDENLDHAKERQSRHSARFDLAPATSEALAVGACIIRRVPNTSDLGVVLSCPREAAAHSGHRPSGVRDVQYLTPGLWHLPQGSVKADDFSISAALARAVREETGLVVTRVVGTLDDSSHHLHRQRDIQALSPRTTPDKRAPSGDGQVDQETADGAGLGIQGLDELMKMIDLSCVGVAASFAAARAAQSSRNITLSAVTDGCHVCDLGSPGDHGLRLGQHPQRRQTLRRRESHATHDDPSDSDSDSGSDSWSSTCESNSDESTCRLLHDFLDPDELETEDEVKMPRTSDTSRNRRSSSVGYSPVAQELPEERAAARKAATLDSDSDSDSDSEYSCDDDDNEDDDDDGGEDDNFDNVESYRECLQLNYIVLVNDAGLAAVPCAPAVNTVETKHDAKDIAVVAESDLDECRMSPRTRLLVRQGLRWARNHYFGSDVVKDHGDMSALPAAARKTLFVATD